MKSPIEIELELLQKQYSKVVRMYVDLHHKLEAIDDRVFKCDLRITREIKKKFKDYEPDNEPTLTKPFHIH